MTKRREAVRRPVAVNTIYIFKTFHKLPAICKLDSKNVESLTTKRGSGETITKKVWCGPHLSYVCFAHKPNGRQAPWKKSIPNVAHNKMSIKCKKACSFKTCSNIVPSQRMPPHEGFWNNLCHGTGPLLSKGSLLSSLGVITNMRVSLEPVFHVSGYLRVE